MIAQASKLLALIILSALLLSATGCATQTTAGCRSGSLTANGCPPPGAVDDKPTQQRYAARTWQDTSDWQQSIIDISTQANIPTNQAHAKIIGPSYEESVRSLAIKLWLIENAQYSIDAMYYIFATDKVGLGVLGALCDAVKRGVDVRLMVDSLGSMSLLHTNLKALKRCEADAGFIRTTEGKVSTQRARAQVVIFNAITNLQFNRRSHDKLLIVDAKHPELARVMTGGRNISLDYYGIKADGSADPTAFRDSEVLLKAANPSLYPGLGDIAEAYYSLLFMHEGNRLIEVKATYGKPLHHNKKITRQSKRNYITQKQQAKEALDFLKSLPDITSVYRAMPSYMDQGFATGNFRLAHQLDNLSNSDVSTNRLENIRKNPNSISHQILRLIEEARQDNLLKGTIRIISPYIFITKYKDKNGDIIYDSAEEINKLLNENPELSLEIVTNSVMTSDNFMTQALIDTDMIPSLLLNPETQRQWKAIGADEENDYVQALAENWVKQVNHPRLRIYQVGKLDSVQLGGQKYYGKLHAKFIYGGSVGFIGTSNFDYRSNLYNNEAGYFFESRDLSIQLDQVFEALKTDAYLWGSPEWIEMRQDMMTSGGIKSFYARTQRQVESLIKFFGMEYLM